MLAVGEERKPSPAAPLAGGTTAAFLSHFLVNDDQRGPYCRLPIRSADRGSYPFCIETDVVAIIVPLPDKVFMKAETAELAAGKALKGLAKARYDLAQRMLGAGSTWDVRPDFYDEIAADKAVRRTYLTFGWRYKARAVRSTLPVSLKEEILSTQFPRFVWVTEFYLPAGALSLDPTAREVMGHVVNDATGSRFSDSPLVLHAPGISLIWRYDPAGKAPSSKRTVLIDTAWAPSRPKVRGGS